MGVDETRDHRRTVQIDHANVVPDQPHDRSVVTDGDEALGSRERGGLADPGAIVIRLPLTITTSAGTAAATPLAEYFPDPICDSSTTTTMTATATTTPAIRRAGTTRTPNPSLLGRRVPASQPVDRGTTSNAPNGFA